MKVLYAIQGTGNGHISRARDIIPILKNYCDLDIMISGTQADVHLDYPVDFQVKGISFIFGKKGGVDKWNTYINTNMLRIQREIRHTPVWNYDFVINDFEPISAWACYLRKTPSISLSHQAALLERNVPRPKRFDSFGHFILHNYAPTLMTRGFHFHPYSSNIYTPIIRGHIRDLETENHKHYTVYLPAFDDKKLVKIFKRWPNTTWQIFSKHSGEAYQDENISVLPVENKKFIHSLATCKGILCGAGFETPAEALFLGKKLMVMPMGGQIEQHYNAAALQTFGVPVLANFKSKNHHILDAWLQSQNIITKKYADQTEEIIASLFSHNFQNQLKAAHWKRSYHLIFNQVRERLSWRQKAA